MEAWIPGYSRPPTLQDIFFVATLNMFAFYCSVATSPNKATPFALENRQNITAKFGAFQKNVCDKLCKDEVDTEQIRLFTINQFPPGHFIPPPPAHCKNSRVEITHMSVTIVCCLLECVLKQHLYLISCVISTQRGQYNTPMHMTGCRFSTPVCCLWHIMCVVLATGCFNTGSVLLEGWGQHSPHAVLTQQA